MENSGLEAQKTLGVVASHSEGDLVSVVCIQWQMINSNNNLFAGSGGGDSFQGERMLHRMTD